MDLVFRDARRFDIIHFHCDHVHFPLVRYHRTPTVTTLHGMVRRHDLKPLLQAYPEVPLVSISDDQRAPAPWANWQGTVYHGLPRGLHTFRAHPEDYLLFIGRICRAAHTGASCRTVRVRDGTPNTAKGRKRDPSYT
jgi:hypothetical protein